MTELTAPEWQPDQSFLELLKSMVEAGMVDAAEEGIRRYPNWVSSLTGEDSATIAGLSQSLEKMRAVEEQHGVGACLVLDHPNVKRLIEWDRLGSRHANAVKFAALAKA
ncbi:hypothetical protein ACC717_03770 [Rhizobium ruizarguesonis]|uniref:Uncharacterized protein n=1 Tax=Rhizobium ruizarguesonis TaxID=2081791 RepID=A0AB38HRF4_9HYPH|nr:hypothetical protein [Rhizobium ruizarguesonis]TBB66197.1 hypothetical protein ELH42_08505 [Rhizobium ruizarguesonis]TBB70589.1 hypothetical protein ELH45_08555 [Rhizobium ruizarguesonis]TBC01914.1 hypothetical protein ELH40_37950 [Rhizobium ruizarguesonis]